MLGTSEGRSCQVSKPSIYTVILILGVLLALKASPLSENPIHTKCFLYLLNFHVMKNELLVGCSGVSSWGFEVTGEDQAAKQSLSERNARS